MFRNCILPYNDYTVGVREYELAHHLVFSPFPGSLYQRWKESSLIKIRVFGRGMLNPAPSYILTVTFKRSGIKIRRQHNFFSTQSYLKYPA